MPEQIAGQPESDASAQAPAAITQADIDKLIAARDAQFEDRIKGFQRLVADKETRAQALEHELSQLKTAGLSPEEREQLEIEQVRAENAKLQAQLDLKNLASQYADEVPYFERLLAAPSAEEQLQIMRDYRTTLAAAALTQSPQAPAAPVEPTVPEVDLNRPLRRETYSGQVLADGTVMTEELADRLLAGVARQADVTQR